jgi:hypothetical protein
LVPSLTVIVPLAMMPSADSGVLAVSGAVPVPIAGAAAVAEELALPDVPEEEDDDVLDDDELVLVVPLEVPSIDASALWTAAVSCVLTRFSAVWLARLAKPLESVVDAPNIELMSESVCDTEDELLAAWLQ